MIRYVFAAIVIIFIGCAGHPSHNQKAQSYEDVSFYRLFYLVLQNTPEHHTHNFNSGNNKVYLSFGGHSETVYDKNGNLVTDCDNMGSFNYFHPYEQPIAHFKADILPWLKMGNCENDPTTVEGRVNAYGADLEIGFRKALKIISESNEIDGVQVKGGQKDVLDFFKVASSNYPKEIINDADEIKLQEIADNLDGYLQYLKGGILTTLNK